MHTNIHCCAICTISFISRTVQYSVHFTVKCTVQSTLYSKVYSTVMSYLDRREMASVLSPLLSSPSPPFTIFSSPSFSLLSPSILVIVSLLLLSPPSSFVSLISLLLMSLVVCCSLLLFSWRKRKIYKVLTTQYRVVCPNSRHPALTSSSLVYALCR